MVKWHKSMSISLPIEYRWFRLIAHLPTYIGMLSYVGVYNRMADGRESITLGLSSIVSTNLYLIFWIVNEARALRIAEIMNDFRTLQLHIYQLKTDPPGGDQWEEGYMLMRQCIMEAQDLLTSQFIIESVQSLGDDGEWERVQLQRYQ